MQFALRGYMMLSTEFLRVRALNSFHSGNRLLWMLRHGDDRTGAQTQLKMLWLDDIALQELIGEIQHGCRR